MLSHKIDQPQLWNKDDVVAKFELQPSQVIDFKALRGDVSDNIPGVKGIGEKTATILLQKYQNLENIYNSLSNINPKYRLKLEQDKENAFLSKELATISREVVLPIDIENSKWKGLDLENTKKILEKYEFRSLIKSLDKENSLYSENIKRSKIKKDNEQLSFV